MFLFLKHKSKLQQHERNLKQEEIAQGIVNKVLVLQTIASRVLQDKSERLTIRSKRFAFVAFCLLSFTCCTYLIVKSFSAQTKKPFKVGSIKVLANTEHQFHANKPSVVITKDEFDEIQSLRISMDSLAKSKTGKKLLDSILTNNHGLVDSLTIIENMYQLQSLNR